MNGYVPVTNVPIPNSERVRPRSRSNLNAACAVLTLTEYIEASCEYEGSIEPAGYSPRRIRSSRSAAICRYVRRAGGTSRTLPGRPGDSITLSTSLQSLGVGSYLGNVLCR